MKLILIFLIINSIHIHTNELNTGLYFCNIEINGVSFETFKFLVVR